MIRVLIADDEKHARDRLKTLLSKYDFFCIDCEAKDGDEVINFIISNKPDVAFLDINMPGVNVFNTISSLKDPPLIVFQTAYSEYAANAFSINAIDYILKPISEERLNLTVEKIKKQILANDKKTPVKLSQNQETLKKISVKNGGKIKILDIEEIYKITFEEGFSFIYTEAGRFLSDYYLSYFEQILSNQGFIRVNRNDIVNTKFISLIHPMFKGNYIIELKNKITIQVSRRRVKELKKIINF